MLVPDDLHYSDDHHWVRVEGELWRVGITEFAQDALGEVTVVTMASPGATIEARAEMGEIEACKAMTDLYMPVDAEMVEHNPVLAHNPTLINHQPYSDGWLCTVKPTRLGAIDDLLDADAYRAMIGVAHV